MSDIKEYKKGDLTVVWKSDVCSHSGVCVHSLPEVFDPKAQPWINTEAKSIDEIKASIDKCPSGALSYRMARQIDSDVESVSDSVDVEVKPNGPLVLLSSCTIKHKDGSLEEKTNRVSFCRCGASENKPYCDGAHRKVEFKDE